VQDLLLDVYACSSAPERWPAVLDQLCDRMSLRSAVIQLLDYRGGRSKPIWSIRDSYSSAHHQEHDRVLNNDSNPRLRAGMGRRIAGPVVISRDEEIFPAGSADLREIQRRRRALRFGANLGGVIECSANRCLALVLHRPAEDHRELGREEEALVGELLPHLRQALDLGERLGAARGTADLLINAGAMLGVGMVLCDGEGRIAWANPSAQSILDTSPAVRQVAGGVRAMAPNDGVPLRALLRRAAEGDSRQPLQLTLGRMEAESAVQVMAMGAGPSAQPGGEDGAVVMLLCEPGRPLNLSPASVAELFGMSPAEARLTAGLCDGLSVGDYARQRGISQGTARIQLKRALAKTGAPRQAELVRRVCLSLAASLSRQYVGAAADRSPARLAHPPRLAS